MSVGNEVSQLDSLFPYLYYTLTFKELYVKIWIKIPIETLTKKAILATSTYNPLHGLSKS